MAYLDKEFNKFYDEINLFVFIFFINKNFNF